VRDKNGVFYVLEDNVRCPSGVSYVLENREVLKRTFPRIFERLPIRRVDDYPLQLLETLRALGAQRSDDPQVVVLTPGRYNSAYYEHAFLAQQMGVELVGPATTCTCERPPAWSAWTSSIGASATTTWIRRCSVRTPCSACPA
jgi:uncharacterized circularly permuted ATP-grasp superfamily protein